jgi:hypothetical protein
VAHALRTRGWLDVGLIIALVLVLATIATILLAGADPFAGFDLTTDPASGLWTW